MSIITRHEINVLPHKENENYIYHMFINSEKKWIKTFKFDISSLCISLAIRFFNQIIHHYVRLPWSAALICRPERTKAIFLYMNIGIHIFCMMKWELKNLEIKYCVSWMIDCKSPGAAGRIHNNNNNNNNNNIYASRE